MDVQGTGSQPFLTGSKKSENALSKTNRQLEKILCRLATARRINAANADGAGDGIAEQLTTQVREFKQASQKISDASAALDIAQGAGTEISDLLDRQHQLALQASSGTLTDTQRSALNTDYQAFSQEIGRIADVTGYNQQSLTNGSGPGSGSSQVQVGADEANTVELPAVNFASLAKSQQATSIATASQAEAALGTIAQALATVNQQISNLGAVIDRLGSAGDTLSAAMINSQAAESVDRDDDVATGLADLTRQQIMQEGAMRTFSRYSEITQNHILGLLQ
jgi:flagellin